MKLLRLSKAGMRMNVNMIQRNLRHIMEFGDEEFEMKILNTGEVVHNMLEFVNVAGLYV